MQLFASINNSSSWQQVLEACQLEKIEKLDAANNRMDDASDNTAFCLTSALSITDITALLALTNVRIMLSLDAPEQAIGQRLQQGVALTDALYVWQEEITAVLQLQQKHRRQLQLVQTQSLLADTEKAPEWLALKPAELNSSAKTWSSDSIYHLVAAQALRQNIEAERCWQRLIASSLPVLEDGHCYFDITQTLKNQQLLQQALSNSNAECAALEEQNLTLQHQKAKLVEEHKARVDQITNQLQAAKKSDTATKQLLSESKAENTLLIEQLFHVQEELEVSLEKLITCQNDTKQQTEKSKALEAQNTSLEEQTLTLQKQQAKLVEEHQLQVKELIEKLRKSELAVQSGIKERSLLKDQLKEIEESNKVSEKQAADYKEENEQILKQLFQTQEELEALLLNQESLSNQQTKVLSDKDQQLTVIQSENALLLDQLFHVQEALETSFNSEHALNLKYTQLEAEHQNNKLAFVAKFQASQQAAESDQKMISETQQSLQALQDERKQLKAQVSKLAGALEQSQHYQGELEQELKEALAESVHAKYQLAATQRSLESITASKSWRGAAPARKLAGVLSRKKRPSEQLQQDIALIMTSEHFDITWYLQTNPDIVESGINPAEHYLLYGANEGRSPSAQFDGNWYLAQYPDVAKNKTNPLLHYIKYGAEEGRATSPKLLQHLIHPNNITEQE